LEAACTRCNETLRDADRYCSVCGLPHLTYVPAEMPALELGTLAEGPEPVSGTSGIAWRPALSAALLLALPTGVLCSELSSIGQSLALVWMVGAAAWAVSLYGKSARKRSMTTGAGARIGFITGLFAGWLTLSVNGITIWAQRFIFHHGGQIDSDWVQEVDRTLQLSQQTLVQLGMATAMVAQSNQLLRSRMLSAEGRAGYPFFNFLTNAGILMLFAILGGAVSARFLVQPRRSNL